MVRRVPWQCRPRLRGVQLAARNTRSRAAAALCNAEESSISHLRHAPAGLAVCAMQPSGAESARRGQAGSGAARQPASRRDAKSLTGEAKLPRHFSTGLTVHGVQLAARKANAKSKAKPALAQRGSLLFSHRGVTGPAVLDLSHHAVMALERGTPSPGRHPHNKDSRTQNRNIHIEIYSSHRGVARAAVLNLSHHLCHGAGARDACTRRQS